MRILAGRVKANQHLAFSPDGRRLACGGNARGVAIWDVGTNETPTTVLAGGHGVLGLHFDPNTDRLFVGFAAGGVWAWGPRPDRDFQFPGWRSPTFIHGVAISPDGKAAVVSGYRFSHFTITGHALDGDKPGFETWSEEANHWASSFAFRPGPGDLFGYGSGSHARTFVAVDPTDRSKLTTYPVEMGPGETLSGWTLSPDGARVAFTTQNRVRVMEPDTLAEVAVPAEVGAVGRAIAFHPGGELLAVGWDDGVKVLDARTLSEVRSLSWRSGRIRSLAFAPDGMTAATAGERGWVTLWDVDV